MGLGSSSYLSLLGLWLVFLFQPASAANAACPSGWLAVNNTCFGFFTTPMSWGDAEAECQKLGSNVHLASIDEEGQMKSIGTYISKNYQIANNVWIGLQDDRASYTLQKRQFIWSDHRPVLYMSWGPAEPNNEGEQELCVDLMTIVGFQGWADSRCEKEQPYLCRTDPGLPG
ncbi:C-type lectin BfL-2 isoform X2 [Anolis carolinensis]